MDYLWIIVMFLSAVWRNLHRKYAQIKHRSQRKQFKTALILWCFISCLDTHFKFWRHPFTAEDPLVSKWCNATFLQICSDEKYKLLDILDGLGWVHFQQTFIFEWTISLRMVALRSYVNHISYLPSSMKWLNCLLRASCSKRGVSSVETTHDLNLDKWKHRWWYNILTLHKSRKWSDSHTKGSSGVLWLAW